MLKLFLPNRLQHEEEMSKIQLSKLKLQAKATNLQEDWDAYYEALEAFEDENPDLAEKKMLLSNPVSIEVQMLLDKIEESAQALADLEAEVVKLTATNQELEDQNQKLQKQLKEELSKKETAKTKAKAKDEAPIQETPKEPEPNPATQE